MSDQVRTLLRLMAAFVCCGCGSKPRSEVPAAALSPAVESKSTIVFRDVTLGAGVDFELSNHAKSPLTILETTGGGCAWLDYDNDGRPDIVLVGPHNFALYHNLGGGRFSDVTQHSGIPKGKYWMGCAVGDYDGDGRSDIFLTGYQCYGLFHNLGGGKFEDVTSQAGISGLNWSISAGFADVNGDEKPDLIVSQYIKFDRTSQQLCTVGSLTAACGPEVYDAIHSILFLNRGNGTFTAQTLPDSGKTWGVLATKLTPPAVSLYFANDMVSGDLIERSGPGWQNNGSASGTAFDAQGHVQGGMGLDSADYDNDGKLDLIVTTFFAQPTSLYHNDGGGLFTEVSARTGVGPPTMPFVGFGVSFADFDCDGWQDIILANGHVRDNAHALDAGQSYAQPVQVFQNHDGKFTEVTSTSGLAGLKLVGRALAVADYDGDGKPDVLICNLEGKAVLLHNESQVGGFLTLRLKQSGPNPTACGALVHLSQGSWSIMREMRTGNGLMSSRLPEVYFGVGDRKPPFNVTVQWPDGKETRQPIPKLGTMTISR